jgi:hypothetical protein
MGALDIELSRPLLRGKLQRGQEPIDKVSGDFHRLRRPNTPPQRPSDDKYVAIAPA